MSKRFLIRWLLISLGLHLIAAVFSAGYQNSDEHFQILEFFNAWIGRTPPSALPIEYVRMIRPWFQPFLYWLPNRGLLALGIDNPFAWALADRLLSALIGWLSVVALALCAPVWTREARWQKISVIILTLIWYLPAFHARHSSENLSGALFTLGFCWLVRKGSLSVGDSSNPTTPPARLSSLSLLGAGLLWGLAFEARFQVGIMIAGGLLWLAIIARLKLNELSILVAGLAVAIGFGTYLDFLGYGQWTFAPWNYFQMNLIQGYAGSTDVSPWWDYFRRIWTESWPVLAFIPFVASLFFWIRSPRHGLTWTHVPFFIAHVAIAHKETRFLFPLAHAAPVCLALTLATPIPRVTVWDYIRSSRILRAISYAVMGANLLALVALTCVPASPTMRFYKRVYDLRLNELWYSDGENPYTVAGIPMYFYRPSGIELHSIENGPPADHFWYATPHPEQERAFFSRCHVVERSIPDWGILKRLKSWRSWTLFECTSKS